MAEHYPTLVLNTDMQPMHMLPIETVPWQTAIAGVFKGAYSVVHEYEDWEVHSPSMTFKVPSVVMLNEYQRRKPIAAWKKSNLWLRDRYTCQYCTKVLPASELTRDHVIPRYYGGRTSWDNIVAACHKCNNQRGHNTKIQPVRQPFKPSYYELVEVRKEYPLIVPDEAWLFYLMWPDDKVILQRASL